MGYPDILAKALSVDGFATADLRQVQQPVLLPLHQVVTTARSTFSVVDPAWDAITTHLLNLSHLGVSTVALKAHDRKLRVVALRPAPPGESIAASALALAPVMGRWADNLGELVPAFSVDDERMKALEPYANWLGTYTGQDAVKWMAGKLLFLFARAGAAGSVVTVHPVKAPIPQPLNDAWKAADLTKEYVFSHHVHTANYLWGVGSGSMYAGDDTGNISVLIRPWPEDLSAALKVVGDR
jgi:hypothetical protein